MIKCQLKGIGKNMLMAPPIEYGAIMSKIPEGKLIAAVEMREFSIWRTLKTDRKLNPKYPGGIEYPREKLICEGHEICTRGGKISDIF